MYNQTDLQLIQRIAQSDAEALRALYERYGLELLNYLLSRLRDRRLAEEVLQNIMLAIWQSAGRFRGESSPRTWIYAIVRRRMVSAWRSTSPPDFPIHEADAHITQDLPVMVESQTELESLVQAISCLPIDQQEALELFFFRGLSLAEAAEQTGVNVNTFKSKLHRAKRTLRQIMQESDHV
jgi:RNA polymerase sigma factor (sigma-70 family)